MLPVILQKVAACMHTQNFWMGNLLGLSKQGALTEKFTHWQPLLMPYLGGQLLYVVELCIHL